MCAVHTNAHAHPRTALHLIPMNLSGDFNYEFVFEFTIHFIGMHLQILFMHKIFRVNIAIKYQPQNVQPEIAYADGNFG